MTERDGLLATNLTVRYGAATALDGVSLSAPVGRITGVIGPNGAGKTTLFNACFGVVRAREGSVHLLGKDVTHLSTPRRAQVGLGRTFQRMELFESLSVFQNVAMGCRAASAGSNLFRQLYLDRSRRDAVQQRAQNALELCGLTELRDYPVNSLSTGHRRLVEFARVLAGSARVLLLDEPSSGLDRSESDRFARVLRTAASERDLAILLVEHDMALVTQVCQYVHVLDFGHHILEGPTASVMNSDILRDAYLGNNSTTLQEAAQPVQADPNAEA